MVKPSLSQLSYATIAVIVAAMITISSNYMVDRIFFVFLLCAVLAGALKGGIWIGIFAAGLSLLAYFAIFLRFSELPFDVVPERAVIFVLAAAIVVGLAHSRRLAVQRLSLAIRDLHQTLHEVRTLRGLIPICAGCKKIRDDHGFWVEVERYVQEHTEAQFTHGMCKECIRKWYPGAYSELYPEVSPR